MNVGEILILFFIFLMCIPSLASLTRFDQWWIRGFDFPRIQIVFLISLVIIAAFLVYDFSEKWHFISIGFIFLSLFYQGFMIFPYTYLSKKKVLQYDGSSSNSNISILVSNVFTYNKRSDKLIDLVNERKPDLFLTLETDKRWENELSCLEKEYKYTVKVPQDNLYGMHLYSKLKLEDTKVRFIVQEGIPSIHGYVYLRNGKKVRIYCLHPMPPSPSESDTSTNRDAEILMLGRDLKEDKEPVLVFGDLNDVAWSRTTKLFQKISGLLDPRIGRGFFNTFHSKYWFFRWPLDHVFHSSDFTLIEIARERNIGSDHFPMYINLNFEPSAEFVNEKSEPADQEEKEWVEDKIKSANPLVKKIEFTWEKKVLT